MPGCQCRRFIHEKELGVSAWLHDVPVPTLERQDAGNPVRVTPAYWVQALLSIMQNAAIAHEKAAFLDSDDITFGRDAILHWHAASEADFGSRRKNRVVASFEPAHSAAMLIGVPRTIGEMP